MKQRRKIFISILILSIIAGTTIHLNRSVMGGPIFPPIDPPEPPPDDPPPPEPVYTTFRGIVKDDETYNAISGAKLKLYKSDYLLQTVYTASDGSYRFSSVVDEGGDAYVIWAYHDDYTPMKHNIASKLYSSTRYVDFYLSRIDKYALIVGINNYKTLSDPNEYCIEDVKDWYNHLTSPSLDFNHITVLGDTNTNEYPQYDGLATESNIKDALENIINNADENDMIAFISSGHGNYDRTLPGAVCIEAWDSGSGENNEDGKLWDYELQGYLEWAIALRIFVFLDHCFSGGFGPELMNMDNSENVYCTTTCTDSGGGEDSSTYQNGLWTYFFLEYSWQNHFGGYPYYSMEQIFDYAHAAYPNTGIHDSQEFDGNPSSFFRLV